MRFLAVSLALLASACVLFVGDDPGSLGSTCKFDGMDKECGKCIAANCQMQVNACCGSSSCKNRGMTAVDRCASGESDQCSSYDMDPQIAKCMGSSCLKACFGASISCSASTNDCSCSVQTNPSPMKCDTTTIANSVCCASEDWPSKSSSCHCTYWGCFFSTDSCDCATHSGGPGSTYKNACYPQQGSGLHCCRSNGGSCRCSPSTCSSSFETEVPDCSPTNAGCGTGQTVVAACSQ